MFRFGSTRSTSTIAGSAPGATHGGPPPRDTPLQPAKTAEFTEPLSQQPTQAVEQSASPGRQLQPALSQASQQSQPPLTQPSPSPNARPFAAPNSRAKPQVSVGRAPFSSSQSQWHQSPPLSQLSQPFASQPPVRPTQRMGVAFGALPSHNPMLNPMRPPQSQSMSLSLSPTNNPTLSPTSQIQAMAQTAVAAARDALHSDLEDIRSQLRALSAVADRTTALEQRVDGDVRAGLEGVHKALGDLTATLKDVSAAGDAANRRIRSLEREAECAERAEAEAKRTSDERWKSIRTQIASSLRIELREYLHEHKRSEQLRVQHDAQRAQQQQMQFVQMMAAAHAHWQPLHHAPPPVPPPVPSSVPPPVSVSVAAHPFAALPVAAPAHVPTAAPVMGPPAPRVPSHLQPPPPPPPLTPPARRPPATVCAARDDAPASAPAAAAAPLSQVLVGDAPPDGVASDPIVSAAAKPNGKSDSASDASAIGNGIGNRNQNDHSAALLSPMCAAPNASSHFIPPPAPAAVASAAPICVAAVAAAATAQTAQTAQPVSAIITAAADGDSARAAERQGAQTPETQEEVVDLTDAGSPAPAPAPAPTPTPTRLSPKPTAAITGAATAAAHRTAAASAAADDPFAFGFAFAHPHLQLQQTSQQPQPSAVGSAAPVTYTAKAKALVPATSFYADDAQSKSNATNANPDGDARGGGATRSPDFFADLDARLGGDLAVPEPAAATAAAADPFGRAWETAQTVPTPQPDEAADCNGQPAPTTIAARGSERKPFRAKRKRSDATAGAGGSASGSAGPINLTRKRVAAPAEATSPPQSEAEHDADATAARAGCATAASGPQTAVATAPTGSTASVAAGDGSGRLSKGYMSSVDDFWTAHHRHNGNLERVTVPQMRAFLRSRGAGVCGTKSVLLKRVRDELTRKAADGF